MEINELKSAWDAVKTPSVSTEEIKVMLSENRHPVLKGIRRQMTIEITGWIIFLSCYYTMFDGDMKPLWINLVLVLAILMPLIHNLLGYRFAKYPVHGTNMRESLKSYLVKIKIYAVVSVLLRQIYLAGVLWFFTYGLSFHTIKYILLVILVIFLVQLLASCGIWAKRLKNLKDTISSFYESEDGEVYGGM